MELTLTFSDADAAAIASYAKEKQLTPLDFVRDTIIQTVRRKGEKNAHHNIKYITKSGLIVKQCKQSKLLSLAKRKRDLIGIRAQQVLPKNKRHADIIGVAEGKITVPKEFDELDAEILQMFNGEYNENFA